MIKILADKIHDPELLEKLNSAITMAKLLGYKTYIYGQSELVIEFTKKELLFIITIKASKIKALMFGNGTSETRFNSLDELVNGL